MSAIAGLAVILGIILLIVGGIWFLVEAFRESIWWGVAILVLNGIAELAFLIVHWRRAKDPFFLQLWGLIIVLIGHVVLGGALPGR